MALVKYFVSMGADIHSIDRETIIETTIPIMEYLFSCGYHVDEDLVNEILKIKFNFMSIERVKYLLGYGADINCVFDNKYFSNVICNVGLNHITFLVENYYDLIEPKLNDIFVMACANGSNKIVKYFCKLGMKIDNILMIIGCYCGHYDVVEILFKYGLDYNDIDENLYVIVSDGERMRNCTSLKLIKDNPYFIEQDFLHRRCKHLKIFTLLIEHKVPIYDFGEIFRDGHYDFYNVDIVKYCIDNGMDINKHILLSSCIYWKKIDLIKLLLNNNINVNLESLHCGLVNDNDDMKKLFMDYGYEF